ncbi:MAG: hypothetical protein ACFCBU_07875 [Cyanophyceae cyanobacterium]
MIATSHYIDPAENLGAATLTVPDLGLQLMTASSLGLEFSGVGDRLAEQSRLYRNLDQEPPPSFRNQQSLIR